jgi:hypothetical protein
LHIKTRSNCCIKGGSNFMSAETTDTMPVTTWSKAQTTIINYIITSCGFPDDSSMIETIQKKEWMYLTDVITLTLDDVSDLKLVNNDGSYTAKPWSHHVRKRKAFLLLYNQISFSLSSVLDKADVLNMTKTEFNPP